MTRRYYPLTDDERWEAQQAARDEWHAEQWYEKAYYDRGNGDCDEDTCTFCKEELVGP